VGKEFVSISSANWGLFTGCFAYVGESKIIKTPIKTKMLALFPEICIKSNGTGIVNGNFMNLNAKHTLGTRI